MKATWRGRIVADSEDAVEVDGYHYFPRSAVRMGMLRPSPKTADDQICPHGVQFFDLVDGSLRSDRAAWSYESPKPNMAHVDHLIGFWEDVVVE